MTVRISRYDTAEYLKSGDDIQAYLDAVLDECDEDPAYIIQALGIIARAKNMSRLARDTGLSREGLYKALSEEGNPTFATVTKIAKALGLKIRIQAAA